MLALSLRRVLLIVALVGGAGCKKKQPPPPPVPPSPPVPTLGAAEALPGGATDGAIGVAGPARFIAAAADGGWVALCQGEPERLRVVVGDGEGLVADRTIAGGLRDVIVADGDALVHVDAVARTARRLGPFGPAAIDETSRRVIRAEGSKLVVHDPGVAPRTIDTGTSIAMMWSRNKRWLEVADGEPSRELRVGGCGWVNVYEATYPPEGRRTIDLDPSGLEALDRVGPELGVTAGGEITLDGAVVARADCAGAVVAALASPPRALVMCTDNHNHVVGAGGFDKPVGGAWGPQRDQAMIAAPLTLGERVYCVSGACIDLLGGREFETYGHELVWRGDKVLVRKDGGNLLLDDLDQERQRTVVLPRITQAVVVDTATGRRTSGPAPTKPIFVDGEGAFLLYGRHVIDVDRGVLVATLAEDARAIDRSGRVLMATGGQGPFHWRKP